MHMDVLGGKRLAAFGTHHDRIEHLAAVLVLMKQGPAAGIDHVRVTPMDDRHDYRIKVETLLRQDVLVSLRRFLIRDPAQHAEPNQLFEPLGEQMPGDPGGA